jgi:outer membrane cobalamin receptor
VSSRNNNPLQADLGLFPTVAIAAQPARQKTRIAVAPAVAAAVAAILYGAGGAAYAEDSATPTAKAGLDSLEEIVVTATVSGVKKLDASYSITSASAEEIQQFSPKSAADILKLSPGIWPESSGGQTGANIEIAGIPGGGDAPFFTNMIEGTPLYGMPSLSFMDSSSLYRLDDTIDRVEIVQGGPGAVFGPGQMGATANYILKRGTATPSGSIGVTYGSEGLIRFDGFYGFKITDGWYASVGGFWRSSDGVRDPQFKADEGGQLTATLSHDLDNGSFMLWARTLDDKNQFIVPIPMIQNDNGSFAAYPGFDPLTSSYGSRAIQYATLPNPNGGFENADLANGRGSNLSYFGGSIDMKFGAWSMSDKFVFNGGDLNTNALFSGPNPRPLSYYLYGCHVAQSAGSCNGSNQAIDANNLGIDKNGVATVNGDGQGLPANYNVTANYVGGGKVDPNQSVINQGWWYIQKKLKNFTNEFRLSKEIAAGNTLTGGLYLARYTDNDNWSLGNNMLMTNTPNARPITLSYVRNATTYNITSPQGFISFNNNYNIVESGVGTNVAFYLSDSWKMDRLLVDASGRVERINVNQNTCNRSPVQMGAATDLWDNAVNLCNGTFDFEHYVKTAPSFTVGANYEIADNMSVYGRANTGAHFPDFDNGIRGAGGNFPPLQKIWNVEAGFKYQSAMLYVDASIYHKDFTGLQYQETDVNGNPLTAISNYGASSNGLNLIVNVTPIHNLNLRLIGDYMDGKYKDYIGCAQYQDINGNTKCQPINGVPLQRQPKVQFRFIPSYKVDSSWGDVTGWLNYEHVGQHYQDQSGLQPLGTYYVLGAGVVAHVGKGWELRVQGTNLSNELALTEGNSRIFGANAGIGNVLMARPIEGREVNFGVKYKF